MARIQKFVERKPNRLSLHDPIDATAYAYEFGGRKLFQINTAGRSTRDIPGKVSQTIQLDEHSASQLFDMLKRHFGFR